MKAFQSLRRKVGAMIGGFEGGLSARRLKAFQPSRAHVNTLIQAAGADMTARARYLIRNNGYAANAVESWASNAVGTGIKPSSGIADAALKDRVQRLWLRWTDESDAEGDPPKREHTISAPMAASPRRRRMAISSNYL